MSESHRDPITIIPAYCLLAPKTENRDRIAIRNATCQDVTVPLILVHGFPLLPLFYSLLEGLPRAFFCTIEGSCLGHTEEEGVDEAKVIVPTEAVFELRQQPESMSENTGNRVERREG